MLGLRRSGEPGWDVGVGLTWGDTAGSASPARSCRKQVSSLMVGIFSDVPRQGAPEENHHAHPPGGVPGTGGEELSRGLDAPLPAAPRSPLVGRWPEHPPGARR